jgi:hypothetical protein
MDLIRFIFACFGKFTNTIYSQHSLPDHSLQRGKYCDVILADWHRNLARNMKHCRMGVTNAKKLQCKSFRGIFLNENHTWNCLIKIILCVIINIS